MRSPWLQLLLLFIYFLLVLVATRLLDLILWYQHGMTPTQVVNPLLLKVQQIKLLLDSRGVSYTEYFEKNELVQLLQDSAEVTVGEVEQVSEITVPLKERLKPVPVISHFSGGAHFYEQVEDTRESVWLVQVITSNEPLLDDYNWRLVCSQLEPFGVRIGMFDCRRDTNLCETKGWAKPHLLLAMPKGWKAKDRVVLQPFTSSKPQAIVDWVHQQLSLWVKRIQSIEEVEKDWLDMQRNQTSDHDNRNTVMKSEGAESASVRVLLLSHLLQPPLFLAALSIKFTGRVHFGMFTVKKEDTEAVRKRLRLNDKKLPIYLVVTPEKKIVYGSKKLEYFNMWSMNVFLRGIQPETNDIFLCSLLLVNMLVGVTICLTSTRFWWKWAAYCLWALVKYNLWLFTAWLICLAMTRFAVFGFIIDRSLLILRVIGLSSWGSFVRTEVALLTLHPFPFLFSFISFTLSVSCLIRLFSPSWLISSANDLELDPRPWWEVLPMDSYWVNYLFRPMASLSRPMPPSQVELEDGIEMLIERLAVPNFWLQPVIPVDYIKDLPIWRYHGWNKANEQPLSSLCKDKQVFHTASPKLLEQMMDADDPQNLVLCCCANSFEQNPTSSSKTCSHGQACSQPSISACAAGAGQGWPHATCSAKLSPKLKVDATTNASRCFCTLTPGFNGAPNNCRNPFARIEQSPSCRVHSGNLRPGRSKCVACARRNVNLNAHRNCAQETDVEESDVSDFDNVGWAVPDYMLQTTDCAVCLEGYNYGSLLCGLPCGHNYHHRCIVAWLQRDNHHCPICRWPAYRTRNQRNHLHQE